MRTLEQRLKFDHGLPIGLSIVDFTHAGNTRRALVRIGQRGKVEYLLKPLDGDMYSSWTHVKGDASLSGNGAVFVWAARNPEMLAQFDGDPVATVAAATK